MIENLSQRFFMPCAPEYSVAWNDLDARFPWIEAMRDVAQDSQWHAEGDVWIHTRMVCEVLASLPSWRSLPTQRRLIVWLAALLHDVAKPYSSQEEDGRIRSRHHSPRGAVHSRRILWEEGASVELRENVCGLVRHHQLPVHALSGDRSEERMSCASLRCNMSDLALLAEADIRGRICEDTAEQLDSIELFAEYCHQLDCWEHSRPFASPHTRMLFFRDSRPSNVLAFDDTTFKATLLCGLPGAGKTHWRSVHRSGTPVVSMDAIRVELRIPADANQGAVRREAKEQARVFLRKKCDFIWDATNLLTSRRRKLIDLFRGYGAAIEIVVVEAGYTTLWKQNSERDAAVPKHVIRNMLRSWEMPDESECDALLIVTPGD